MTERADDHMERLVIAVLQAGEAIRAERNEDALVCLREVYSTYCNLPEEQRRAIDKHWREEFVEQKDAGLDDEAASIGRPGP
jgi:hypothetical protein